jgi:hypothetical protein
MPLDRIVTNAIDARTRQPGLDPDRVLRDIQAEVLEFIPNANREHTIVRVY